MNHFTFVLVCLTLLVSVTGCGEKATVGSESEEHLEHFVPPHKPASYADLVKSLRDRIDQVSAGGTPSETQKTELLDVIRWIPEIAADSDLLKSDWEVAAGTSVTMERLFQECFGGSADGNTVVGKSDSGQSGTAVGSVRERFQPLISTLDEMVSRSMIDDGTATGLESIAPGTDVTDGEPTDAGTPEAAQRAEVSEP
ncbi:MAG: hypothetical protein ACK526_17955 [Planctomyces sp.]|jgi:hypothetical protein